jgi:putative peptide zinc metalloprotease protein
MSSFDHRRSAVDRALPFRARGDLEIVEVAFGGQSSYVVKDPVTGEVYHLSAEEHRLLQALRRPVSLAALGRILEAEFAPRKATPLELQAFVNQLHAQGLVVGENPGQGGELLARGQRERRRRRWSAVAQLLSVRLGGWRAGPFIDALYPAVGWMFSRAVLLAALGLVGYALVLVVGNASSLAARLPALHELARPTLLPVWIAAIAGVKILHELGHALACRHFGARPQEMGVLLLAGAPALYCDVSDAWRLPSKWQRMAVSAAGMMVELVIAAAAAVVWAHSRPGLLAAVCLSLIIVCSVGTLLINLNPLLRYDGYYLLADWLEAPNLADRARGLISARWRRWLLKDPPTPDALLTPRKRRALWVYAIASRVYLTLVLGAIFYTMVKLARPHQLQNVVYTLAALVVAGIVARPIVASARLLMNPWTRSRLRWLRLAFSMALLAGVVAGAAFIPITRRVSAPMVARPAKSYPLFAVAAGQLEFALPAAAEVRTGDVVARLRNAELELTVAAKEGEVRERRLRVAQLRTLESITPSAGRRLPTALAELADAQKQLAEQRAMLALLEIRAPAAGRILPVPEQSAEKRDADKLAQWHGSPLDARKLGAWIEPGTPLAIVAAPGEWIAWAGVPQADVPVVEIGQPVRLLADQGPTNILTGRVAHISRTAHAAKRQPSDRRAAQASLLGDDAYHVVEITLDQADPALLPGARGAAKIATYHTTIGDLVLLHLRRTFRQIF